MAAKEHFLKLHRLLLEQEKVIDRLISAGEEQTGCLRQNDVRGLQQVLQQQNTLTAGLAKLEKQRLQVQKILEQETGLSGGSTLRDFAFFAGGELQARLEETRSSLREKTRRLLEINDLNRTLTRQGLQFANLMLNLLKPQTPGTVYSPDGRRREKERQQGMINKTV